MEVQSEISALRLGRRVGTVVPVMVDAIEHDRAAQVWRAVTRSAGEAPEVDGSIYVLLEGAAQAQALPPGSQLQVRIVGADQHDLFAVPA